MSLMENWTAGLMLIMVGGIVQGCFMLPMKYTRKWNWENTWLSFSFMAYLILPWLIALLTVPQLKEILKQTSTATLLGTILFGFGWGLGCLTFGLGVDYLGLSLGFAIILGLTAAIGTLVPLLVLAPEKLMSAQGAILMTGVVAMLVGISLCSWAGKLKEDALKAAPEGPDPAPRKSYALGLLFCILSGILSACANLGFAFGSEVTSLAAKWGTRQQYASIPLWAVLMLPLFLCNAPFCLYLLKRKQSLAKFLLPGTGRYYFLAGSMAVM
jgi:L-rhamnose-H+ transport protein